MKRNSFVIKSLVMIMPVFVSLNAYSESFEEQRKKLLEEVFSVHGLTPEEQQKMKTVFNQGKYIGQGNPKVAKHPATPAQCKEKLEKLKISYENKEWEKICGDKYMAPLYDPAKEKPQDAKACIDQFEFPNIPCAYPVVWVRAKEAQEICESMGKRMCDAHEWEGGCAGALLPHEYRFDLAKGVSPNAAFNRMRKAHNAIHNKKKVWSYGKVRKKGICAMNSSKTAGCQGGGWNKCGSNTYPTGMFPDCKSSLGVYDIHGNAAEHMNLPLAENEMTSKGSKKLGQTEMKGSWFIFDKYKAHADHCRWRAPYWHGTAVMSGHSHHNYHLGFRCCKTVK